MASPVKKSSTTDRAAEQFLAALTGADNMNDSIGQQQTNTQTPTAENTLNNTAVIYHYILPKSQKYGMLLNEAPL